MSELRIYDELSEAREEVLKRYSLRDYSVPEWLSASLEKLFGEPVTPAEAVARIIQRVRTEGDAALLDLNARIDGADLDAIAVPEREICLLYTSDAADE